MIPPKTLTVILLADAALAVGVVAWGTLNLWAQSMPPVANGWQLAAFLAVIALQAYGMYVQRQNAVVTQDKVETVHKALNSQLDAFKVDAANASRQQVLDAIGITKAQGERDFGSKISELEARIQKVNSLLEASEARATTLAAAVVAKEAVTPARGES